VSVLAFISKKEMIWPPGLMSASDERITIIRTYALTIHAMWEEFEIYAKYILE
jgi:hypothetical protein